MKLPTDSQWARYSILCQRLQPLSLPEREVVLQRLRATGDEDSQVLALVALHRALPPHPMRDRTGDRLGDFTLEEPLGAGGMGVVYRAQQHIGSATRPVAVKLIHPTLLQTARKEALARFQAEIDTLVKLEYEGIARIYSSGITEEPHTHEQIPYIAMELIRGGLPITTYTKDYALSWQERLALFLRLCRAVQYAHEHRVIHRDLKPANILVDSEGRPFVIDFGLAYVCDALLPGAHMASGTPAYMSPEQVSDAFGPVSAKSDVYALGLILYELLTEQLPYALPRDGTFTQWYQVITEKTPPPLYQSSEVGGGELEEIMAAALAKQSTDRIRVDVLRSRIERYLKKLPPDIERPLSKMGELQWDTLTVPHQSYHVIASAESHQRAGISARFSTAPDMPVPVARRDLGQADVALPKPAQVRPLSTSSPIQIASLIPHAVEHDSSEAERRQLTIMFCDLVGSTALSEQFDPEDLREVIQAYLETCNEVITHFAGYVGKYLGDGVLVYFGYPQAHEDDPQRAVRAGLELIDAIARLNTRLSQVWGVQLAVRMGIHTGLVVAGELRGGTTRESRAIVGEAPNIAARLQALAAPNTVVISAATAQLVHGYFTMDALGPQSLVGIARPIPVYRVVGESEARTRLDVAAMRGLTPLIGREQEVRLLLERWEQVQEGRGQVVLLSGEAGIGKSRLVQVLQEHLVGEVFTRIEWHCSPYFQHSALYPVIEHVQKLLKFRREDTPEEKLGKLEKTLKQYGFVLEEAVPLCADLLSLPLPDHYPSLTLSPQRRKQKSLEILLAWLLKEAERQPVCLVVDDLHWSDHSTLEFLDLLIDQTPVVRIFLLMLFRSDFSPPWAVRSRLTQVTLDRLNHRQIETMVERVAGGKPLPAEILQHLIVKTDGVPLFVEELTKMVLESTLVKEQQGKYALAGPLAPLAIPATLHDSLMARLDRLGPAKQVAQLGATIGREFSYELIQAVLPWDEELLREALRQLVAAELLYQRGLLPQATYLFKHALIQEAAYQLLLKRNRQWYHHQVAKVLEEKFPEVCERQPELLAYHFTEASLIEQAIPYWQCAGQLAVERSANIEAISHFTKGLALLETLPEMPERVQQELALQLALGEPLLMVKGQTAPEVGDTYNQVLALCQQLGEDQIVSRFAALAGLWRYYVTCGRFHKARELGEQCLLLAEGTTNHSFLQDVHRMLGSILLYMGELPSARDHLEKGIPHPHSGLPCSPAFSPATDLGVVSLSRLSWTLWLLGYPESAWIRIQEAFALAQQLSHMYSVVFARYYMALIYLCRGEVQATLEQSEIVLAISQEHGFVLWSAEGLFLHGWALVRQGRCEEGIAQMQESLVSLEAMGVEIGHTSLLMMLAESYWVTGQTTAGWDTLAAARDIITKNTEHYYEAEFLRLSGELLLQESQEKQSADVERYFQQACRLAHHQHAKAFELRAAMSLCRLWQSQGRHAAARDVLADVYSRFTEGFDTADLKQAKALIDGL